ncbi:Calcium-independent phospholipase A2-gamma [Lachnellula suecica]|uniref:Calcium-independent phospholipase A2-gamma n=1 Tax=Lachnellula suecica TaxID=602035 RepID=A0A8T9BYB8_9HELO|nr:Calcium-independent phospholipase A2-gamma [Lachnellula suecica]
MSELIILQEIMHRVERKGKLTSAALPADYFDMICGTSTGGLIALLLGRLRLSVPVAIEKYRLLAKDVFSKRKLPTQDGIFKASNLEKAMKDVVEEALGKGRAEERMFEESAGVLPCKRFVCAMPTKNVSRKPRLFRTWRADKSPGHNARIWEAGRATSAAPPFLREFIDGAVGCNNPILSLIEEARQEFDPNSEVGSIISIGTGKPKVSAIRKSGHIQRMLPASVDLVKAVAKLATSSEGDAVVAEARYRNCPGLYHRLNVDVGLEEVSLEEWKKLAEVKTQTLAYMDSGDISQRIDTIVDSLLGNSVHTYLLSELDGTAGPPYRAPPAANTLAPSSQFFEIPSFRVRHFVERKGPLEEIDINLSSKAKDHCSSPAICVLLGMGGCGKSQLALEFCHRSKDSGAYTAIFWIDATSPASAIQSFASAARIMSKSVLDVADNETQLQFVRTQLSLRPQPWLLVFDNFDDPNSFAEGSIKDYFPQGGKGAILVTSRHSDTKILGPHIEMDRMSPAEALELLLTRSGNEKRDSNTQESATIVERLGFHALAIDQAAAYISSRNLDIRLYLEHYNARTEKVLTETPDIWDYIRAPKESPQAKRKLSVFTTWELSFEQISGDDSIRKAKERILTLLAFFDNNQNPRIFLNVTPTNPITGCWD